jgi:hypothetical protein
MASDVDDPLSRCLRVLDRGACPNQCIRRQETNTRQMSTEGGWIVIFETEKIAPHGNFWDIIPRICAYEGNLRALETLVASESPQLTF